MARRKRTNKRKEKENDDKTIKNAKGNAGSEVVDDIEKNQEKSKNA